MKSLHLVVYLVLASVLLTKADPSRPNIIIITADDMGYGDWEGSNAESKIKTPHLNQLAREGLTFTDGHSPSTVCTPSRYGLLTGINPAREGITNTLLKFGRPLIREGTPTLATFLREQGYTTRMVGKWHLGFHMDLSGGKAAFDFTKPFVGGPVDCGFDSYYGLNKAPSGAPFFYIRDRGAVAEPTETIEKIPGVTDRRMTWQPGTIAPGFIHEEVVPSLLKESVNLIRGHAAKYNNKPLFFHLALTSPHTPWVPSTAFQGKSEAGVYGDFVEEIDDVVGSIQTALKESGMEKNTLVLFSSDNGAMDFKDEQSKGSHDSSGVLRAGKAHPYEGGHRVPFIAKWPEVVPAATTTKATVNQTDIFATLLDILEVSDRKKYLDSAIDSHSFLAVLKNPAAVFERPPMFNNSSTCRVGDWKIVVSRKALDQPGVPDKSQVELFNLATDLSETTDVASKYPERFEALLKTYLTFKSEWTLRPEAVQYRKAKADKEKSPGRKPKTELKTKTKKTAGTADLETDYKSKLAELSAKLANTFTEEEHQARDRARKKALEEGKKGVGLRAVVDAAVPMSNERKKEFEETRKARAELMRAHRDGLERERKAKMKEGASHE